MKDNRIVLLAEKVKVKKCSTFKDFEDLWNLFTELPETQKKLDSINDLARCFWTLCIFFKDEELVFDATEALSNIVDYIYVNTEKICENNIYEDKGIVFAKFLYWLHNKQNFYYDSSQYFMSFYQCLYDVLDSVKWVFRVKDKDGKRIYPIGKLLEDAALDFQLDEEHYLHLVFSLQLFNHAEIEVDREESIKAEMISISDKYNIALIKMLCNGGHILNAETAAKNSTYNETIIAVDNQNILIRNSQEEYFSCECEFEGEDKNNALAFYTIERVGGNYTYVSLKKLLRGNNNNAKCKAIEDICKHKYYNIFLGDVFYIDTNTSDYVGIINRFCYRDEWIISKRTTITAIKSNYYNFWNKIATSDAGLRTATIKESHPINILCMDFLVRVAMDLMDEETLDYSNLESLSDDDFYQNQVLQQQLESIIKSGKFIDGIKKYRAFIERYWSAESIDRDTLLSKHPYMVMPLQFFMPFKDDEKKLLSELKDEDYFSENAVITKLNVTKTKGKREYKIEGEDGNNISISEENIHDLYDNPIKNENNIKNGACVFEPETQKVKVLFDNGEIVKSIQWMNEIKQRCLIDVKWLTSNLRIRELVKVIASLGFEKNVYRLMGEAIECKSSDNIALYKLLWHIQICFSSLDDYCKLEHLILDLYYCKFNLNPESYVEDYLKELEKYDADNALIIAKETDGAGATLNLLLERFSYGDRGPLRLAFDDTIITNNIIKNDDSGQYLYRGKDIKTLVFITDNALSGVSTEKMLNYYLFGVKNANDKRTYLWEKTKNPIIDVVKTNNPQIVVATIFYSERARKRIDSFVQNHMNYEDFHSENQSKLDITIWGVELISEKKYRWTEEVKEIVNELYDYWNYPITWNEEIQCIMRPLNMPSDYILPPEIKDTEKLIGIFHRKKEL